MLEMLKKSMLTGIGLALKTRDEVEELARDWSKKQKMSEEDGRKFLDEMMDKYDSSVDKLEERVEKAVRDVLKKTSIATRDEVDELRAEIALLRTAVNVRSEPSE
ncbi:hypothetical protein DENIS_3820 [Desulfonema ishimotonii]|uniref:Phasin superfamily protein n=1 Tax=Desulfonema ishimotonii TaxID=45657 RepID=A0A401G0W7_9BACT|nr:hypothetical protein [Desulfonema ishimotonii]GBC62836.1 hypothetical protein DENIS_3820 [Desulfonema ishimotonii]